MSTIICLPVDMRTNSLGLPSLLAEEIDGESVLYHTVSRLTLVGDYKVVLVFADGPDIEDDLARARELVGGLECEFHTSSAGDVVNRGFLRRGRLFALSSWRGGMGWTSYYDEAGAPAALAEAAERFDAETVGLITPDSPYADPQLTSQLLLWHRDRLRKAQVTVTGVPPGLAPAFFTAQVMRAYASEGLTLAASMAYKPAQPQRDLTATEAHYEADMKLRLAPWRLTAHSRRQVDLFRELARLGHSPRGASGLEVVAALGSHSELWAGTVPAKVEIEPTSRIDAAPFYLADYSRGRAEAEMAPADFAKVVETLLPYRDVVISLEGLGEALLNPEISRLVALAAQAGLLGVHLGTYGRLLDERAFDALRDARLDILSVHLGAAGGSGYNTLFGDAAFEKVSAAVETVFTKRRESSVPLPLIVVEMTKIRALEGDIEPFYNYWLGRCDWPVIRPYNDFAGQLADEAAIHMRTSQRLPCRKIFNELYIDAEGIAWPCRQDINRTHPLGSAVDEGIPALWHCEFMEKLRQAHAEGDWDFFPLCAKCRDWYYTT